jgi:hypothetical protein
MVAHALTGQRRHDDPSAAWAAIDEDGVAAILFEDALTGAAEGHGQPVDDVLNYPRRI